MLNLNHFIIALTDAFLSGPFEQAALLKRGQTCLGVSPPWLNKICQMLVEQNIAADRDHVAAFLKNRSNFRPTDLPERIAYYYCPETRMQTVPSFAAASLPILHTVADLQDFLKLPNLSRLEWFADHRQTLHHYAHGPLCHYEYRWQGHKPRLLCMPKTQLKRLQKRIAQTLLASVPVHAAAHGFTRGHSTRTFVAAHCARHWVLRLDLTAFFPSIGFPRIYGFFRYLGYAKSIARYLTLLCTHRVPKAVLVPHITDWYTRKRFEQRHLPQGAPTSPALANLVTYALDCRLTGLADSIGANYTRYADDLLFSGDEHIDLPHLITLIGHIVADAGFSLNYRKTRVMGHGQRQQAVGIVFNQQPQVSRQVFDRFKAILHNCVVHGVDSQRQRYQASDPMGRELSAVRLQGQLAYFHMINPEKAQRLTDLYRQIKWPS